MIQKILLIIFSIFLLGCNPQNQDSRIDKLTVQETEQQVVAIIHYMGWYSDIDASGKTLRHWEHGHANSPLIGKYNSQDKSTLIYHALLAWAAGIDAIAINVKDNYDYETMIKLFNTIDELEKITKGKFQLKYLVSYDDQGFDIVEPYDTTYTKMVDFKNNLMTRKNYLNYKNHPLFFSFDYPNKFLTANSFRKIIDTVFSVNKPYLMWNTFGEGEEVQPYVNAFYPWVQPGGKWEEDGSNWGKNYLDYFYKEVNTFNTSYDFVVGGVWAGFDDRKNTSWGGNRLISRQDGKVYDNTWNYVHKYSGNLPMKYIVLETWNDWNEGTEIEPSIEHGYKYLLKTSQHLNQLKTINKNNNQEAKFKKAKEIHDAIQNNENIISDSIKLKIQSFCNN